MYKITMYNLCSLMLYILALYLNLIVWYKVFMDVTRTMMQPTVQIQVTIVQLYVMFTVCFEQLYK